MSFIRFFQRDAHAMARKKFRDGFSLVEVTLAIGVVAFSFLGIFSLLPMGLGVFRQAMDTSVSAQIVQRIVNDAEQTDFDTLINNSASGAYYALPMRYFDDQGSEIKVQNPSAPTAVEIGKILYWVRVRGSLPGQANTANQSDSYFTSLPSTGSQRFNPRASTYLTIQITSNPAGVSLNSLINAAYLVDAAKAKAANLPLQTYSIVIARNGYNPP